MKRMAIMKGIGFGMRDRSAPVLWFEADEGDCATLQVLSAKDALKVIEDHAICDIRELEGKPCWVDHDEEKGTSKFLALVRR